jgi:hypothetical protein
MVLRVAAATAAVVATAAPVHLTARLTGAQESPPQAFKNAKATGTFTGTLRTAKNGYRLRWQLTFSKLSGVATSAYIHQGKRGTHGAALLQLCAPCKSGATGDAFFSPPELTLARAGSLYVNVRTPKNPNGEIRGQIRVS